uniref:Uncharacterized protein n=1 Tax=Anguilla anguilla TaxID=7936 RepID=A0A0E9XTP5_ANGAN
MLSEYRFHEQGEKWEKQC